MKLEIKIFAFFILILYLIVLLNVPNIAPKALRPVSKIKEVAPTISLIPTSTPTFAPTPSPIPTSTPIPTPSPVPINSGDLEIIFTKYASLYNVDGELLKKIADCESNFNTFAVFGDYLGLFQFATNTWINSRGFMGENTDPALRTNPEESIKTAAFKISQGGLGAWPTCGR
jgi:soluble lytic murein transglycosylase-like protein